MDCLAHQSPYVMVHWAGTGVGCHLLFRAFPNIEIKPVSLNYQTDSLPQATKEISHIYTYIPPSQELPPTPMPAPHLSLINHYKAQS